jgi:hypothetical protein
MVIVLSRNHLIHFDFGFARRRFAVAGGATIPKRDIDGVPFGHPAVPEK